MTETKTYNVSLALKDPLRAVDPFYKYRGEHLPKEGEIIDVVRFIRGHVVRARVTGPTSGPIRRSTPASSNSTGLCRTVRLDRRAARGGGSGETASD